MSAKKAAAAGAIIFSFPSRYGIKGEAGMANAQPDREARCCRLPARSQELAQSRDLEGEAETDCVEEARWSPASDCGAGTICGREAWPSLWLAGR